tara:strand:+ start:86 stop:598 length:513 start_codon:yes stop_codon:yes gene_type:complete
MNVPPLGLTGFNNQMSGLESAFKNTDQFKAYEAFGKSLEPTADEQMQMQQLTSAFQNTDQYKTYQDFGNQMNQMRQNILPAQMQQNQSYKNPFQSLQGLQSNQMFNNTQQPSFNMQSFNDNLLKGLGELFEQYFPKQNNVPDINKQEQIPQGIKPTQVFGNMATPFDRQY